MGLLWVRVFVKGRSGLPASVSGETAEQQALAQQQSQQQSASERFEYVEMPVVAGRNDQLARDMFGAREWNGSGGDVKGVSSAAGKEGDLLRDEIRSVAQNLKFEAIIKGHDGRKAEVFIENKLLPTGSELAVRRNGKKFIFTIENAEANTVTLRCGDVTVTLKMSDKDEEVNNSL